jgi:AcrR family transcriptional regulator
MQICHGCNDSCYAQRVSETTAGHRERKKQRTREAIARAGHELFVERGYDTTTLAEIADAAGVSARTIFAYFPSKQDILFSEFQVMRDRLAAALAERPGGKDALGTLRDFILAAAPEKNELDRKLEQLQELLAAALADDLDAGPDDLRPQIVAASLTAAFEVLELQDRDKAPPHTTEELAAAVDPIIAFVRAGLEALPAPASARAS